MLVGLTGSIAVGKSTVAKMFESLGTQRLDADDISRAYLSQISIQNKSELLNALSVDENEIFSDGFLDKSKLRSLIFSNKEKKTALENLLHPLIASYVECFIGLLPQKSIVIYEASLLVETGRYRDMDILVVVTADESVRLHRLMERNSITELEAKIRIVAQLPQEEKVKFANYVIDNSSSIEELRIKVENVLKEIRNTYDSGRKTNKTGT